MRVTMYEENPSNPVLEGESNPMTVKDKAVESVALIEQDGLTLLHIPHEPLRRYLTDHVTSYNTISYDSFHDEDDTDATKRRKDRLALFALSEFIDIFTRRMETRLPPKDVEDEEIRPLYKTLYDLLRDQRAQLKEATRLAFASGRVTFDQLCLGLTEDREEPLFVLKEGVLIGFKVESAQVRQSMFGRYIQVNGRVYGWNGTSLASGRYNTFFHAFPGTKTFKELKIEVLTDETKAMLIARGQKYLEYNRTPSYAMHAGTLVKRSWYNDQRYNASGRIMVDMASMQRANPDYREWFGDIEPGGHDSDRQETISDENISPEVLLCMSPYVYGFSFVSKAWGEMIIDNVSPVKFRADAYDKLILDPDSKEMIKALVEVETLETADFIDGKGGGCIFLLSGPPGGGKTLTAEAVAERLERPLYAVGIGELGVNVGELEENLSRILETAAAWRAVLLIDEADIFLEVRSDLDISRNAMVAVFLRLLEYYQGILFLTSNRGGRLDPAFQSRIGLKLHYNELTQDDRNKVWRNLLSLYSGKVELAEDEISLLAGHPLNGREIKNIIRLGVTLGVYGKRKAKLSDFEKVIQRGETFTRERDK